MKKLLSYLLCIAMLMTLLPAGSVSASEFEADAELAGAEQDLEQEEADFEDDAVFFNVSADGAEAVEEAEEEEPIFLDPEEGGEEAVIDAEADDEPADLPAFDLAADAGLPDSIPDQAVEKEAELLRDESDVDVLLAGEDGDEDDEDLDEDMDVDMEIDAELSLNTPTSSTIDGLIDSRVFAFTPGGDGQYTFYTYDNLANGAYYDLYAVLYSDLKGTEELGFGDNEAANRNPMITASLKGGKTYYLQVSSDDELTEGSFKVMVTTSSYKVTIQAGDKGNFLDGEGVPLKPLTFYAAKGTKFHLGAYDLEILDPDAFGVTADEYYKDQSGNTYELESDLSITADMTFSVNYKTYYTYSFKVDSATGRYHSAEGYVDTHEEAVLQGSEFHFDLESILPDYDHDKAEVDCFVDADSGKKYYFTDSMTASGNRSFLVHLAKLHAMTLSAGTEGYFYGNKNNHTYRFNAKEGAFLSDYLYPVPEIDDEIRVFDHWVNAAGKRINPSTHKIHADETLTARWTDCWTLTLLSDEHSRFWDTDSPDECLIKLKPGTSVNLVEYAHMLRVPEEFRDFYCWLDEDGNEITNPENYLPTRDGIVLTALCKQVYNVIFSAGEEGYFDTDPNAHTWTARVLDGEAVRAADIPSVITHPNPNKSFKCWSQNGRNVTESEILAAKVTTEGTIYTAVYDEAYQITLDAGPTGHYDDYRADHMVSSRTVSFRVRKGGSFDLTHLNYVEGPFNTDEHLVFDENSTFATSQGTFIKNPKAFAPSGNTTVNVVWTRCNLVTFHAQGGHFLYEAEDAEEQLIRSVPGGNTIDDYPVAEGNADDEAFVGWFRNAGLTDKIDPASYLPDGDVHLYAKYEKGTKVTLIAGTEGYFDGQDDKHEKTVAITAEYPLNLKYLTAKSLYYEPTEAEFLYWADENGTEVSMEQPFYSGSDVKLHVVWKGMEPSDPSNPTDPENPVDPANPTDPASPTGSPDPSSPTTPTDPVTPTNPATNPTEPELIIDKGDETDSETNGETDHNPEDIHHTVVPADSPSVEAKAADGTAVGEGASAESAKKAIVSSKSEEGPGGTKFAKLALRLKKAGKNSITIRWNKVSGATKYVVFGASCEDRFQELARVNGTSYTCRKTADGKKLSSGKYYKFIVMAIKGSGSSEIVVSTSKAVHITTTGKAYNNFKAVKLKVKSRSLKARKSYAIKSTLVKRGKKAKQHRKVSYESSNPGIAKVNSKGKVTAVRKGTAKIYVYAADGTYKVFVVKVKS